jgi:hypothetical protein
MPLTSSQGNPCTSGESWGAGARGRAAGAAEGRTRLAGAAPGPRAWLWEKGGGLEGGASPRAVGRQDRDQRSEGQTEPPECG